MKALVNGLGTTRGLKVLDLGCGDGTTALLEVKLGAEVLGVDIPAKDATSIPATFLRIYVAV